jgi:NAD(P)-dependent dehydrogenase (short-subunit alcohol dehydrogenase family)
MVISNSLKVKHMSKQKVALITGGTRGIGLATGHAFAKAGYKIALNYSKNAAAAAKVKDELAKLKYDSIVVQADVAIAEDRARLISQVLEKFGHIDVLVNNAGVARKNDFLKTNIQDYEYEISCNLNGPVFLAKDIAKHMVDAKINGNIINICSVAGHKGLVSPGYAASKAALLSVTKLMARELARYNIRVNSISPGAIKTDINKNAWQNHPKEWDKLMEPVAMQRAGEPSEIADAVVMLASNAASYITGTDIVIDGGFLI